MRRDWLSRALDRADPETLAARLEEALANGAWGEVFELVRRLAPHQPYDVRLLNLGARAATRLTDREAPRRLEQASAWLQRAMELAPGDVETLYQLGRLAAGRRLSDAALDFWRRAWAADPDDPEVRDALLQFWIEQRRLPDWGVPALEQMLLKRHHDGGWTLLLQHYESTSEVSAQGHRLLLRRFQQGDRGRAACLLLANQLRSLDRFDEPARQVYLAAAEHDPGYRSAVVRCDGRQRQYVPERLPWYLERAGRGECEAALLVARGWLAGQVPTPQAAPSLRQALAASPESWSDAGLDRPAAVQSWAQQLALMSHPPAEALPVLLEALTAAPDDVRLLEPAANLLRPSLEDDAVALYLRLFEASPGHAENTGFLATSIAAGQLATTRDEAILTTCLEHGWRAPGPLLAALAQRLAAVGRDDDAALGWLSRAADAGVAGRAELWLARLEARRQVDHPAARERFARLAADPAVPDAARLELAEALAVCAPTTAHLRLLGELQAPSGAEALMAIVERAPEGERAVLLDQLARERFVARDWPAAARLTAELAERTPGDSRTAFKCRVAAARLAMAGQEPWPGSQAEDGSRLGILVAAAAGEAVSDAALADVLRTAKSPAVQAVAAVLDGRPAPGAGAATEAENWLLALLDQISGRDPLPRLRGATEPEPRLWQAWCAGPTPAAALGVLRQSSPPWTALHPAALDHAVREAPLESLDSLLPRLSRPQRAVVEARRAAHLADSRSPHTVEHLKRWASAWGSSADALRLAVAGRLGTPEALAAAPADGPGADRVNWLRVLRAWEAGEPAEPFLDRLPAAVLALPEVAWTIAAHEPERAYAALSKALHADRERLDLLRGLCHLAALADDRTRAEAWAVSLRATDWAAAAEVAVALLSEPWDEPVRWAARIQKLAPEMRPNVALAIGAAGLMAGRATEVAHLTPQPPLRARRGGAEEGFDSPSPSTERGLGGEVEFANLLAAAHWSSGDAAQALALLQQLAPLGPAGHHNAAVAAESLGDLATAIRHREAELAARAEAAAAWQIAARRKIGDLAAAAGDAARAVEHLSAALALRPDDAGLLGRILSPLLAIGQADEALAYSERRLAVTEELAARLDHATVLATAEGAPAAAAWLESLAVEHPEAAEAVKERRVELADRLESALRERAAEGDYHALFAAARDAAAIAPDDEARARALLQQAVALGRMADDGDAVARLERAHGFCEEALGLTRAVPLRGHAARLAQQVAQRLAPALADQAEELLRARAHAWQALPRDDAQGAADLAAAFGRVLAMVARARGLGIEAVAPRLEALAETAEKLRVAAEGRADG